MKLNVSTDTQFFYTIHTNYGKIYHNVYFIFCDNNHVIPVINNGMQRLANPILIEPYSRTVDESELYSKCSSNTGRHKITKIIPN